MKRIAIKRHKNSENSVKEITKFKTKNQNLEALRGILAIMVLISHISLIRMYFGRSNDYLKPFFFHLGRVGVTGFFVLSGYLITLSILKRMENKNWSISTFYFGRILRIWPLYYFIIAIAICVLPQINQLHFSVPNYIIDVRSATSNYLYFIFFMPQVPIINNSVLPFAEPTWSIGIEEIFYLIIPWIVVISKKKFAKGLIIFMLLFITAKYIAIYFYQLQASDFYAKLLNYYRYDCIALGCLMGVLHHKKNKIFHSIKNLHVLFSLFVIFILFKYITIKSYDYFPFAICFAVIIAYLVNNKEKFKSPKWLIHIGTVSYSLYLTHEIVVVYFLNLNIDSKSMIAMYLLSILCSVLLASIVYYCVERPFMKLGNYKLSDIKTL